MEIPQFSLQLIPEKKNDLPNLILQMLAAKSPRKR